MTQQNQNTPNTPNVSTIQQKYLMNIKDILYTPVVKQIIFLVGTALGVALGFVLFNSIQEPIYRPLDYQINSQNMNSIVDTLDKAGIQYKIHEQDGMIYVASNDLQLAKLKLSGAGIAKDDSFNFSYLNDQSGIGGSQFLENARYIRALESDLARTINAIEGISGARVHIAIPQNNIFADENKRPTASVVVNMAPGLSSDKEKIRAIVQVIASSVPGLDPKFVAITDQYGHYLSSMLDQDSIYNSEAMSYQNNIQNYYEKRIESIISPILGDNKVNVRVHANIDFTQQEEAQEQYDPNQRVIRSEQDVKEQSTVGGGASGAPGALSNTPPDNSNSNGAQGGGGGGGAGAGNGGQGGNQQGAQGGGEGKTESIKNYEIGKTVKYKKMMQPKITGLSVAVIVDNEVVVDPKTKKSVIKPLSQDKINKITDLVKATIGFDQARGDKVTVVNSAFTAPTEAVINASIPVWSMPWFWDLIKKLIGIALGFALLFMIYKKMMSYLKTTHHPVVHNTNNNAKSGFLVYEDKANTSEAMAELHEIKQEQINKLKDMAAHEPDRVALILKSWVGKH